MDLKRIATLKILDTGDFQRVDGRFRYTTTGKLNKSMISAENDYFVCRGLTYPEIKVTDWMIVEDIYDTSIVVFAERPLVAGTYELFARGTLTGDPEEFENDPDITS